MQMFIFTFFVRKVSERMQCLLEKSVCACARRFRIVGQSILPILYHPRLAHAVDLAIQEKGPEHFEVCQLVDNQRRNG